VRAVGRAAAVAGLLAAIPGCRRATSDCAEGAKISVRAPGEPVGFDATFSVEVVPGCPEARAGRVSWRQTAGAPVRDLVVSDDGFKLRARTTAFAQAVTAPPAPLWGLVPLSPRTRGEVVLEATWRDGRGRDERYEVRVSAAARARGLPNTPLGARVFLTGAGWRLEAKPQGSAAALDTAGGTTSLLPDVTGDWRLADGAGRSLTLRSARYDQTPLDCGRSGCHAAITDAAADSPMTTVLTRGLVPAPGGHGAAFGADYPGCALACHATGEPGVADGGFAHVMGELGLETLAAQRWDGVPRALRRLGGVGCLACHGPGALPEGSARWSVLRSDVCATCHDAPPRYGHVVAWQQTAMARADRDPRAASERACARCHTTWGFLAQGAGDVAGVNRQPPAQVGSVGITCAACHAVHDPARTSGAARERPPVPALLRASPRPALLADIALPALSDKSRVCLSCHTPDPADGVPTASAAALWLGRGGLDPATGQALVGTASHAGVVGGCIGCHRAGPAGVEHGAAHAFAPAPDACRSCHAQGLPPNDLRAQARALWATWRARRGSGAVEDDAGRPPHAGGQRLDRGTPAGRAAWNVLLVLEDPAAAAHNAPYARRLLVAAQETLKVTVAPATAHRRP
jgi:hypothetical protein